MQDFDYAKQSAKNLTQSVIDNDIKWVYLPSCNFHTVLDVNAYLKLKVNGISLISAINSFLINPEIPIKVQSFGVFY